jgi:hypothetical protein
MPEDVGLNSKEFHIVRDYWEAISFVEKNGIPNFIAFDHDLGFSFEHTEMKTGFDFANWLVESELDGKFFFPEDFDFSVHSYNPVGARKIISLLENYFKHKGN